MNLIERLKRVIKKTEDKEGFIVKYTDILRDELISELMEKYETTNSEDSGAIDIVKQIAILEYVKDQHSNNITEMEDLDLYERMKNIENKIISAFETNLYISEKFLENMERHCKFQTSIDSDRKATFIKEWNKVVEFIGDDFQTLYRELSIITTERFLRDHFLVDGNKRAHRYLNGFIRMNIKNEDIL